MDQLDQISLPKLPQRPDDGHKGTFGTVGIIGGSVGNAGEEETLHARMIGAPALTAMGATRAGCGLVKVAAPEPILNTVLSLCPNATGYPIELNHAAVLDRLAMESDSIVIGPGLGLGPDVPNLVEHAMQLPPGSKCRSLILDADGLNALAQFKPSSCRFTVPAVLTPHPGEAVRLLEAFGLDGEPTGNPKERLHACQTLAEHLDCIVVLKGSGTVVCDKSRAWTCTNGHPCLGTGGTGDVLSGMIASLSAQCVNTEHAPDLLSTTCIAVDAHAIAAAQWSQTHHAAAGMNAWDLSALIPQAISKFR